MWTPRVRILSVPGSCMYPAGCGNGWETCDCGGKDGWVDVVNASQEFAIYVFFVSPRHAL
jgi:hypothetical protein